MSDDPRSPSLLEELDRMQDEVLAALDVLDDRILDLIKQCTSAHERELKVITAGEGISEAA